MRNEDLHHRLTWAEFEERYGESAADFIEEREQSLCEIECEAAGIPY